MLESFEKMKWEDIYSYWKVSTEGCMSIVNRAPLERNNHDRSCSGADMGRG